MPVFAGELQQRPDRGEQVIQIVRHAAAHPAEEVEFLACRIWFFSRI